MTSEENLGINRANVALVLSRVAILTLATAVPTFGAILDLE